MESINQAVEQLIEYLNTENNLNFLYNDYCLKFQIGNTNVGITCWVSNNNGQYEFSIANSEHSNDIADFYKMKNIQAISINGGNEIDLDEEKLCKFSELHNLKEIYFNSDIYDEDIEQFVNIMKRVLPQCKIYMGEDNVEVSN